MENSVKQTGINVLSSILGGVHFVSQTVADLSLNAEIKLQSNTKTTKEVINYRLGKTLELQAKLGLSNPFEALAPMTQAQQ